MRITRIEVDDLFGIFKHDIPLKLDDRITIIHSPNGYGKTVVLKMLSGLFNSRHSLFRSIPFGEFRVHFDDMTTLAVRRVQTKKSDKRRGRHQIQIESWKDGKLIDTFNIEEPDYRQSVPLDAIDDMLPFLNRVGPEQWFDLETGRQLNLQEVIEDYSDRLPFRVRSREEMPAWFTELRDTTNVHFIDTERLRSGRSEPRRSHRMATTELAVMRYKEDLADMIRSKLAESAALSQSLDRTFPARLVEHGLTSSIPDEEIRSKLAVLEDKRSRLKTTGLLDKEENMNFQVGQVALDDHTKRVLSVYAEDVEKKLSIFDDIAAKLELFEALINTRFRYKHIAISKEHGFTLTSFNGTALGPADLSSGEQHELVLTYRLLFRVPPHSLILLDEPEISLHVEWQEQYLQDLHKITSLSPFDVLIATHSPQIIHNRWDLTVELKGPDPKELADKSQSS